MTQAITQLCQRTADTLGTDLFVVMSTIAIVLTCLICSAVGSQVVGNRMAFFSDALAHCAFAGITFAILSIILFVGRASDETVGWLIPTVMVAVGCLFGIGIAFVREKTGLASDTVIGVFFAGAIGLGAFGLPALKIVTNKEADVFLFGSAHYADGADLLRLFGLLIATILVLALCYNQFVFASFNPSLARSRRIRLRFLNYLFIILLAFIVNLVLKVVGIMLVNALLVVPAASASNFSRNMRQMFWWTIGLSLLAGLVGQWISLTAVIPMGGGRELSPGPGGCIVLLSVFFFALSMVLGPWLRGRQTR